MNKNYRVKANISQDTVLNVKLTQDVETLEILSLNLTQENFYKLHQSSYGVIIGRVLANDGFGVPNVKVSVFIELEDADMENSEITNLYPYTSVQSFDSEYRRYNLLPDSSNDDCYRIVGTFPNKRLVLDDDSVLDVFDKYWKYTTVTNNSGDYMIFGVPTGNQQIHIDVDLSDIGVLSQRPRDMLYKGYNIEQFDSANQFKESTNLNNLSQIISQNQSVYVYPFWGAEGEQGLEEVAISRCDINIDYKFEPTCVFMGSLVSDGSNQQISHKCTPTKFCGLNRGLICGEGTIEMIRKTLDGLTEDFQIKGNRLIDNDGVWCYQIPMNLDYVQTDEYGNIVPTDNPNKGIPTRARVRFRISFAEGSIEGMSKHRAKYLVPNNPTLDTTSIEPKLPQAGKVYETYYEFGSATPDECYRNLYWNKVYSVKSFIPRVQTTDKRGTQNYTGIRTTNNSNNLNPFPFNKARFKIYFSYRIICLLVTFIVYLLAMINTFISAFDAIGIAFMSVGKALCKTWILAPVGKIFKMLGKLFCIGCIKFESGLTDDGDSNTVFYPGCLAAAFKNCTSCPDTIPNCKPDYSTSDLTDVIQENLAQEYDTVNFDFYNDWVNGCLYFPIWYWKKTKKKKFLFGLFTKKAQNTFCKCQNNTTYSKLKNGYLCALYKQMPELKKKQSDINWSSYQNLDDKDKSTKGSPHNSTKEDKWADKYTNYKKIVYGLIKEKTNKAGLNVYYYSYGNVTDRTYTVTTNKSKSFNRLFSTDIILLGSFNDCDLDGIPKLFRYLPTTSANVPFIGKITESSEDSEGEEGGSKDNGTIVISGMDWLHTGSKTKPKYQAGLLMDLSCTGVGTRLKTIVNIERMSELGVNLDMSYDIPYTNGTTTLYKHESYPDGMITRYEINDNESRFMFASLNHLGLDTLIKDVKTNYDVHKIGAIFPVDFDGMLTTAAEYTNGAEEQTRDNLDANYAEFRLGQYPHAYLLDGDSKTTYYPLYNNSFYFYFGLNEGNTAIDKFQAQYDATCFKTEKYPFSISYVQHPGAWCSHPTATDHSDYARIEATIQDASLPYSFILYNEMNNVVFQAENVNSNVIYFGRKFTGETISGETEEEIMSQLTLDGHYAYCGFNVESEDGLTLDNGSYTLVVTDNKRKTVSQIIDVYPQGIDATITTSDLGVKYYSSDKPGINTICADNEQYGTITFEEFYVDGYRYNVGKIISKTISSTSGYLLTLASNPIEEDEKPSHETETAFLYFVVTPILSSETAYLYSTNSVATVDENDCGCQGSEMPTYELVDGVLTFNVWKPTAYDINIVQICNGEPNDNVFEEKVTISNGKPFTALLDNMPLDFMDDENDANTKFYAAKLSQKSPTDLYSWFNIDQVDMRVTNGVYNLPDYTTEEGLDAWSDYISDTIETDSNNQPTSGGVITIAQNLLRWSIDLARNTYVTTDYSCSHNFVLQGGKRPYLYRTFRPMYDKATTESVIEKKRYVDSFGTSTVDLDFPDIWVNSAETISNTGQNLSQFNIYLDKNAENNYYLATYFAGFSNYGGFSDTTSKYEGSKGVMSYPSSVDVIWDEKTRKFLPKISDTEAEITSYSQIYNEHAYFPAPYIDRRMGYDFIIYTMGEGAQSLNIPLTKISFIQGYVNNGIELAYTEEDEGYNIIANTEKKCNSKDYTYIYNKNNRYFYNPNCKPRYYESNINGLDIRNNYNSSFNTITYDIPYSALTNNSKDYQDIVNDGKVKSWVNTISSKVDKFPYKSTNVNGRFSHENYPTQRYLSCAFRNDSKVTWSTTSCNFDMNPTMLQTEEDSRLVCYAKNGENVEFAADTTNMFNVKVNSVTDCASKSDYNILYYTDTPNIKAEVYPKLIRLAFTIKAEEEYDTITSVFPYVYSPDGQPMEYIMYMRNDITGDSAQWFTSDNPSRIVSSDESYAYENFNYVKENIINNSWNGKTMLNDYKFCFLTQDKKYVLDADELAQSVIYITKSKSASKVDMITNNESNGYGNKEAFAITDKKEKQYLKYITIGGIRKYIPTENVNVKRDLTVVNFCKSYHIPKFYAQFKYTAWTGTTIDTATTSAVSYVIFESQIDCSAFTGDTTIDKVITEVAEKIHFRGGDKDTYISSDYYSEITDNTYDIFTYFHDADMSDEKKPWRELYLKMYSNLTYLVSYQNKRADSIGLTILDALTAYPTNASLKKALIKFGIITTT